MDRVLSTSDWARQVLEQVGASPVAFLLTDSSAVVIVGLRVRDLVMAS